MDQWGNILWIGITLAHLSLSGKIPRVIDSLKIITRFFPSGGTGEPHELYVPLITAVSPPENLKIVPPLPIFADHDKIFFWYFFNLCTTKANLTSITSLRMQTLLSYWNIKATTIEITKVGSMRLQLHDAIYRPNFFVLMLCYSVNLKAIIYKSTSFNKIIADELIAWCNCSLTTTVLLVYDIIYQN